MGGSAVVGLPAVRLFLCTKRTSARAEDVGVIHRMRRPPSSGETAGGGVGGRHGGPAAGAEVGGEVGGARRSWGSEGAWCVGSAWLGDVTTGGTWRRMNLSGVVRRRTGRRRRVPPVVKARFEVRSACGQGQRFAKPSIGFGWSVSSNLTLTAGAAGMDRPPLPGPVGLVVRTSGSHPEDHRFESGTGYVVLRRCGRTWLRGSSEAEARSQCLRLVPR